MDDFDKKLTRILTRIQESSLSNTEKADSVAELDLGLHKLVWPILVSHIPENELKDVVSHPETLSVHRYGELMGKALSHPETAKEIHEEVIAALAEIETLTTTQTPTS